MPTLTGAAIQGLATQGHDASLASSPNACEMVHADSMECASDDPNCLAGWRCRQRSSGDGDM